MYEFKREINADTPDGKSRKFQAGEVIDKGDILPGSFEVLARQGVLVPYEEPKEEVAAPKAKR